jgi:hypothetical protein
VAFPLITFTVPSERRSAGFLDFPTDYYSCSGSDCDPREVGGSHFVVQFSIFTLPGNVGTDMRGVGAPLITGRIPQIEKGGPKAALP